MNKHLNEDVQKTSIKKLLDELDNYIYDLEHTDGIEGKYIYQWVDDLLKIKEGLQYNYDMLKQVAKSIGLYDL